jgi:ABC-2 type transport system permease protein
MKIAEQWIAFCTIIRKEIVRFTRIWVQTLLPPVITMGLYFVIFGHLIGSRIGQMDGFDYMDFVVPGLIMMSVITNSYSNVVSSFFGVKFQRSVEELLVSPTPNYIILLGYVLGGVSRGLLVGLIVTLVSLFFTDLSIYSLPITISIVLMTSIVFSLAGFLNAVFAKTFDDISIVPTFILTPLTYLGGVFYSISLLPPFWQAVSQLNPILYMVNAFRYGILGISDIDVRYAFMGVLVFVVLLSIICLQLLARGTRLRS